ncbi:MAG: DUF2971 domain-containing protein [Desulfobacteraceae bacterium]|nr:DUF2971 domain-containing protein [Desulfobacteraceae bacterium]
MYKEINSKYESKEPPLPDNYKQHLKRVEDLMNSFSDPCDGTIYHYTSASGFQGIVESGEIWLTNTDFVNDTTDCKALQEESRLFGEGELSCNRYIEKYWPRFLKNNDKSASNFYVASFNKNPDSLEQWRAYGNICIGFDVKQLKKNGFYLYKCVYDKSEIKEWVLDKARAEKWMLDEQHIKKHLFNEDGSEITYDYDARPAAAMDLIYAALTKLKHSCFENEKEVRLLAVSHFHWPLPIPSIYDKQPPIHFRQHQGFEVPVPYVKYFASTDQEEGCDSSEKYEGKTELQVKEEKREKEKNQNRALLPIKEIWVGPTPHKEETRLACEILLQEKGYKDVPVNISGLPYRGF